MFKFLEKFRKKKEVEEEVVEIEKDVGEVEEEKKEKILLKVAKLGSSSDVDRVAKLVKQGNILFLKIKDLKKMDIGQFQATLHRVRKLCDQFGWDVVALEGGYLLIAPPLVKIVRPSQP